jgi:hypothetical protein
MHSSNNLCNHLLPLLPHPEASPCVLEGPIRLGLLLPHDPCGMSSLYKCLVHVVPPGIRGSGVGKTIAREGIYHYYISNRAMPKIVIYSLQVIPRGTTLISPMQWIYSFLGMLWGG